MVQFSNGSLLVASGGTTLDEDFNLRTAHQPHWLLTDAGLAITVDRPTVGDHVSGGSPSEIRLRLSLDPIALSLAYSEVPSCESSVV